MAFKIFVFMFLLGIQASSVGGDWVRLSADKIHDPSGPALEQLQEPAEGLAKLPTDMAGNQVRWARALNSGVISPRRTKTGDPALVNVYEMDMDIMLDLQGSMNIVRFPHKAHTQWLACENCHNEIFKPQKGSNNIAMFNILNGEQCGRCHGAVAFPVTECRFCHSVPHTDNDFRTQQFVPNMGAPLQ
jgi:c(7)-type cytochrome triheme protein